MSNVHTEESATSGLHDKVKKLEIDVATVNKLMVGVNIVMFLGFISLTVAFIGVTLDSFRYKVSSQQEMRDEIKEVNLKLDYLNQKESKSAEKMQVISAPSQ